MKHEGHLLSNERFKRLLAFIHIFLYILYKIYFIVLALILTLWHILSWSLHMVWGGVSSSFCDMWYPVVPASVVGKSIHSSLNSLGNIVKDK